MPVDKEFTFVAGWILKIINSYKYWTPNPYTLILNNPRECNNRRIVFAGYLRLCALVNGIAVDGVVLKDAGGAVKEFSVLLC